MKGRLGCAAVAVVASLLAGACSAGHKASAPTTTVAPDPYAIPAVITPAYVDRVFVALNNVNGDVSRQLVEYGSVTSRALSDIRAIYNDPLYTKEVEIAQKTLSYLGNIRRPPGNAVTAVVKILYASQSCIFVSSHTDASSIVVNPGAVAASEYLMLKPKQSGSDPSGVNPTPWAISYDADYLVPTPASNQCVS